MVASLILNLMGGGSQDYAYTDIVDAIRIYGYHAQSDIEELWKRIAFSILINNVDDHLHNHGFLHVGNGRWKLAPAFDINPFPDRERELKTWISYDRGPEASLDSLMTVASYFRISKENGLSIIEGMKKVVSKWRQVGEEMGMSSMELNSFENAFLHCG